MQRAQEYLQTAADIAIEAGAAIMEIYERTGDVGVQLKEDDSPVTDADLVAHRIIVAGLRQLTPDVPVLSEESSLVPFVERQAWSEYWLVDPLDGTREFLSRNGEFTVNIALVRGGEPVLGVVYVPVSRTTYCGVDGKATISRGGEPPAQIAVRRLPPIDQWGDMTLRVVASRRHGGEQLADLLPRLKRHAGAVEQVSIGSSLKFCMIAEGRADIYPRLGPTSEWDTAAAHAVLQAAGGEVVDTDFAPLRYNRKPGVLNPNFIALGDRRVPWQELLT